MIRLLPKPFPRASHFAFVALMISGALLTGCGQTTTPVIEAAPTLSSIDIVDLDIVTSQIVFVPAYSEIFYGDSKRTLNLTTTLAIHNTDPQHSIIVKSVHYFNTDGELVREFIDSPVQLEPMATTGFVIDAHDDSGGWGANFMVEWGAEEPVYEPVIEAVMISSQGTEGVSFVSPGRVVSETKS